MYELYIPKICQSLKKLPFFKPSLLVVRLIILGAVGCQLRSFKVCSARFDFNKLGTRLDFCTKIPNLYTFGTSWALAKKCLTNRSILTCFLIRIVNSLCYIEACCAWEVFRKCQVILFVSCVIINPKTVNLHKSSHIQVPGKICSLTTSSTVWYSWPSGAGSCPSTIAGWTKKVKPFCTSSSFRAKGCKKESWFKLAPYNFTT